MRQFILCAALLLVDVSSSQAQSVISSSGSTFLSSAGTLEWTVGEPAIQTHQHTSGYLTQGFHQTYSNVVMGLSTEAYPTSNIEAYPNPTSNFIYVYYPIQGQFTIEVFSGVGLKVIEGAYSTTLSNTIQEIDFRNLSSTVYLVFIRDSKSGQSKTFKIIKD